MLYLKKKVSSYSDVLSIYHNHFSSKNKWHWKHVKAKNVSIVSFPSQSERPLSFETA